MTHVGRPTGFIIAGMHSDDVRIEIAEWMADVNNLLIDVVADTVLKTSPEISNQVYAALGRQMRAYHDAGNFHRYPHNRNWGVEISADGKVRVVMRDLDTTQKRDSLTGKSSLRLEAAYRFLDLERIISDLSAGGTAMSWGGKGSEEVINSIRPLVENLLRGYFPEIPVKGGEFQTLLVSVLSPSFPGMVRGLRISDDKIVFSANTPAYGTLWKHLYDFSKKQKTRRQDDAMKENTGGIDFNPDKLHVNTQSTGKGIMFNIDPAMLQRIENAPGITPVIINILPLDSLQWFLGIPQSAHPAGV